MRKAPTFEMINHTRRKPKAVTEQPKISEVDYIIAYESGELSDEKVLELFSLLIKNGDAWTLQGSYGRMAQSLIEAGYLDRNGNILKYPEGDD